MATTTQTATITRRAHRLPRRIMDRRTINSPRALGGTDIRSGLLPTTTELVYYLDSPDLALQCYCMRTGVSLILAVMAFRAVLPPGGAA